MNKKNWRGKHMELADVCIRNVVKHSAMPFCLINLCVMSNSNPHSFISNYERIDWTRAEPLNNNQPKSIPMKFSFFLFLGFRLSHAIEWDHIKKSWFHDKSWFHVVFVNELVHIHITHILHTWLQECMAIIMVDIISTWIQVKIQRKKECKI